MRKYKHLDFEGNTYTDLAKIEQILKSKGFYWLIDSEFENAEIKLEKNTIIWQSGDFYSGDWEYGIWLSGKFHGKFINGIFEDGSFNGKWVSGIDNTGKIKK